MTNITVLLDRSGSMTSCLKDIEGGFNTFISEQKEVKEEATISLFQFDNEYEEVYRNLNIQEAPPLKLVPRNLTALLDSIDRVIVDARNNNAEITKKCKECGLPLTNKNIIVIITDGLENASHEVTKEQVFKRIAEAKKDGFDFVFLGADQDAISEGHIGLGVTMGSTMSYKNTKIGNTRMFCSLSNSMSEYRTGKRDVDNFFDEADREECNK